MVDIYSGTVVRYCKPSTLDEQGKPTGSSFQLRIPTEKYLSVYFVDYFNSSSEKEKITEVKHEMQRKNFNFKKHGVFSTLDIEQSKDYILESISEKIAYKELDLPHCGIFHEYDDLVIAELLSHCVENDYSVMQV